MTRAYIRYTVNQLDNITGQFPEAQERLIASEEIASSQPEFWRVRAFDIEALVELPGTLDVIVSRDPLNGDWIGVANGGNYEWAEEAFFQHDGDTMKSQGIARAIETYLNDFDHFASCK